MDAALRKHCQTRKSAALQDRSTYLPVWREVADHIDPFAGRFLTQAQEGAIRPPSRGKIINSTATASCRTMDSGFTGGMTSKARPWFRLVASARAVRELPDVKAWCDDVGQIIRDILARSNFYTALPELYHSRHLFGIGTMLGVEDAEQVVRFYPRPIGTYAVALSARGLVDTMWHEFVRSAGQLRDEFGPRLGTKGEDGKYRKADGSYALPAQVQLALDNDQPDQKFKVQSLIEPNPKAKPGRQAPEFRPHRQVLWLDVGSADSAKDSDGCLEIRGFYKSPLLGSRWLSSASDCYSPSPAIEALGDVKGLQYWEGKSYLLLDQMADPAKNVPEHLRNRAASVRPGANNYILPGQNAVKVEAAYVPEPGALERIEAKIAAITQRIERAFFVDLFRMLDFLDDRERTAFEFSERKDEKIAALGPSLESLTDEVLDPVIGLVFDIAQRLGILPPPPDALSNMPINVDYVSMLAQAAKAVGLLSIDRVIGFCGQVTEASGGARADVWDNVDVDEMVADYNDFAGGQARALVPPEKRDAMRQQKAQAEQAAKMAEMAPQLGKAAQGASQLATTVPQQGSIADNLAQQMAGG